MHARQKFLAGARRRELAKTARAEIVLMEIMETGPPPARPACSRRRAIFLLLSSLAAAACGRKKRIPPPATAPVGAVETGIASWYGHPYHGRRTASGEIYDMEKLTAAHRTLPFGTWVEVTNLANGKRVRVRITDRGPFVDGRIIDLSRGAAQEIDMVRAGIVRVRLEVIGGSGVPSARGQFAVQIGAYQNRQNAERMQRTLRSRYRDCRLVRRDGPTVLWRVLIGREDSEEGARQLALRLREEFGTAFVVRLDEPGGDDI